MVRETESSCGKVKSGVDVFCKTEGCALDNDILDYLIENDGIAGIKLKNPVMTASGTFAVHESSEFYDISKLGAVVTKGVSVSAWEGNATPRIAECYGGMLNSVGLENPGVEAYIENELVALREYDVPVIANVAGHSVSEYCKVAERLNETDVAAVELNVSCPNVRVGGMALGTDPALVAQVTAAVKHVCIKPIIVKLSPNVTDITEIAKAAECAGADALSLINTLLGMRIDARRRVPVLANVMGGMSGPAVKPVALRMVYQVRRAVNIPIIGLGGIVTGEDAAEFIMAGADAVAVGTAALVRPDAPVMIIRELKEFMEREGFKSVREIREAFE